MKILAIDIGNTRTRMAVVEDRKAAGTTSFLTSEMDRITETFKAIYQKVAAPEKNAGGGLFGGAQGERSPGRGGENVAGYRIADYWKKTCLCRLNWI